MWRATVAALERINAKTICETGRGDPDALASPIVAALAEDGEMVRCYFPSSTRDDRQAVVAVGGVVHRGQVEGGVGRKVDGKGAAGLVGVIDVGEQLTGVGRGGVRQAARRHRPIFERFQPWAAAGSLARVGVRAPARREKGAFPLSPPE